MLMYHTQRIVRLAETLPPSGYNSHINQYGQSVQTKTDFFDPINAYALI